MARRRKKKKRKQQQIRTTSQTSTTGGCLAALVVIGLILVSLWFGASAVSRVVAAWGSGSDEVEEPETKGKASETDLMFAATLEAYADLIDSEAGSRVTNTAHLMEQFNEFGKFQSKAGGEKYGSEYHQIFREFATKAKEYFADEGGASAKVDADDRRAIAGYIRDRMEQLRREGK